jgi:CubicO group peptidase (beta-lactamase class C family)
MRTRTIAIGLVFVAVLAVLAVLLIPRLIGSEETSTQAYWPTGGWRASAPEEQGFDSGRLAEELQALEDNGVPIDSLLIVRDGYVVLDAYFYPYDNTIPHKLASVTKSVMTTLIGIAVDQGKIDLDRPMVSFFPGRAIANLEPRKEQVTVRHLVSMRNGFASGCLAGDEPTLDAMRAQPDWVQAALDRQMANEPGAHFCYDSPGMHLLSAVLQEATGMTALEFGRQYLFEPLGIREVWWQSDPQGYTHGWGDLFLKPRGAAKIGYLWLNQGTWEGEQIVSASWVADSVTAHSRAGGDGYGYGWWVSEDSYTALGRGGQNIKVYPGYNAIVVTTASAFDYDQLEPLLSAAFVDPDGPLPADPAGVAELEATLEALAAPPSPWPVSPVPEIAGVVSGATYLFGPNPAELATLRPDLSDPEVATLTMTLEGRHVVWPIGLDGKYRVAADGQGLRGYWTEPQTLVVELFEEGLSTLRLHFEEDRLEISSPALGLEFEGRIEGR